MKRFQHVKSAGALILGVLVLFTLSGASVWEGAAALAPRGELPEDGYYAATNSFPQNTVVDITNLETGKSVRAIVSSGLNTPGLLAILSPDTASRIGLSARTIGRIRMTQPEDPIAFSRFTEGLVVSGDPDYDPEAMIAGDAREIDPPPPEDSRPGTPPQEAAGPYDREIPRGIEYSDYADYSRASIVDIQGGPAPRQEARAAGDWEEGWDERAYSGYLPEDEESIEGSSYQVWERGGSVGRVTEPAPPPPGNSGPPAPESPPDPWAEAWREAGASQAGTVFAGAESFANSAENESRASARILVQPPPPGTVDYSLVPTGPRPPAGQEGPPRERPPAGPDRLPPAGEIDQSLFIDSIEKEREAARAAEAARATGPQRPQAEAPETPEAPPPAPPEVLVKVPEEAAEPRGPWVEAPREAPEAPPPAPPEVLVKVPEEAAEPRGPWVEPLREAPEAPPPAPPEVLVRVLEETAPAVQTAAEPPAGPAAGPFSVPVSMIAELETGKYYVQLGAYRNIASVESALLSIDPGYPLKVQRAGSGDNPVYRLLVGPLNLGESGALVQRFKGSGYSDAYVRSR
jgi:hypothetical protein